jgi:hypothetical protein
MHRPARGNGHYAYSSDPHSSSLRVHTPSPRPTRPLSGADSARPPALDVDRLSPDSAAARVYDPASERWRLASGRGRLLS